MQMRYLMCEEFSTRQIPLKIYPSRNREKVKNIGNDNNKNNDIVFFLKEKKRKKKRNEKENCKK